MYGCPCENCQRENYADYSFGNFTDVSVNTQAVTNSPMQSTVVTTSSKSSVVVTSPPSDAMQENNTNTFSRSVWIGIGVFAFIAVCFGIYQYRQSKSETNAK